MAESPRTFVLTEEELIELVYLAFMGVKDDESYQFVAGLSARLDNARD